jgi:hypothetical protein
LYLYYCILKPNKTLKLLIRHFTGIFFMKKRFYYILFIFIACHILPQKVNGQKYSNGWNSGNERIFKFNLTNLLLKNIGVQMEHQISSQKSLLLGISGSPMGTIPFKNTIMSKFNGSEFWEETNYKTLEITPEIRFYLSKRGNLQGLYLAPYLRYNYLKGDILDGIFNFGATSNIAPIPIDIKLNFRGVSAGLMIGSQWKLNQSFYLDWWIAGAGLGSGNGTVSFISEMKSKQQEAFKEIFENSSDIPYYKYYVNASNNLGRLEIVGPWASIRGGLAIGFRF